jgi:(1->4)-alpha-D-glucan 1-alpha-D-glucosylmutase
VVAFARRHENSWAVVVAARLFSTRLAAGNLAFDPEVWRGNSVALPQGAPGEWLNIFTQERLKSTQAPHSRSLPLEQLFRNLPVALLFGPAA